MKLVQGNQLPVSNYEPRTADNEGGEDELRHRVSQLSASHACRHILRNVIPIG